MLMATLLISCLAVEVICLAVAIAGSVISAQ
jgi:hypothetical protein